MLVRSPWQMSPPAITEVVAAVRLARIDGVARPARPRQRGGAAGGNSRMLCWLRWRASRTLSWHWRSTVLFSQVCYSGRVCRPKRPIFSSIPWCRTPRATVLRCTLGASNVLVCGPLSRRRACNREGSPCPGPERLGGPPAGPCALSCVASQAAHLLSGIFLETFAPARDRAGRPLGLTLRPSGGRDAGQPPPIC